MRSGRCGPGPRRSKAWMTPAGTDTSVPGGTRRRSRSVPWLGCTSPLRASRTSRCGHGGRAAPRRPRWARGPRLGHARGARAPPLSRRASAPGVSTMRSPSPGPGGSSWFQPQELQHASSPALPLSVLLPRRRLPAGGAPGGPRSWATKPLRLTTTTASTALARVRVRGGSPVCVRPITGAELTLDDGSHLTLLVEGKRGYANLCRLIPWPTRAPGAQGRREPLPPALDPSSSTTSAKASVCLSGCARHGLGVRDPNAVAWLDGEPSAESASSSSSVNQNQRGDERRNAALRDYRDARHGDGRDRRRARAQPLANGSPGRARGHPLPYLAPRAASASGARKPECASLLTLADCFPNDRDAVRASRQVSQSGRSST